MEQKRSRKKDLWISIFLGFSVFLAISSQTMLSPALPAMEAFFHTTPKAIQNLIGMNMFISGVSVLLFGALSYSLERKRLYLFVVGLLGIAAIASALCSHLFLLFVFQGAQAIGASACSLLPLVIVKDIYPGMRGTKIFSVWGIIMPLAPALGASVGGFIVEYFTWQAIFLILALGSGILWMGLFLYLPASLSLSKSEPFSFTGHLNSYKKLLTHRRFLGTALLPGLGFGGLSAYTATAPFVFIQEHGVSPSDYGLFVCVVFFGMMGGSFGVRAFVETWPLKLFVKGAVWIMMGAAVLFLSAAWLHPQDLVLYAAIMMVYGCGLGIVLSAGTSWALDLARSSKGHAAALLRGIQFVCISGGTFLASDLYQGSFAKTSFLILGCALMGQVVVMWMTPRKTSRKDIGTKKG